MKLFYFVLELAALGEIYLCNLANQTPFLKNISVNKINVYPKINPNKKKILDFIKSFPNTRTKDIIYEFNSISDRTVKRNLTELAREGLIRRKVDNKAVYYYASE